MDILETGAKLLTSRSSGPLLSIGNRLLFTDTVRKPLVRVIDGWLRAHLDKNEGVPPTWRKIMQQRKLIYLAVLHTVDRVVERRILSPQVSRVIIELWGRALCLSLTKQAAAQRFKEEHGYGPPWFITISPGHACNLRCKGCYANSEPSAAKLPWTTFDRIMTEAKQLWGVPLFVISGGEPLLYRSEGRDVLDAKGATYYGIGSALAHIVNVILRDQRSILTVCTPVAEIVGVCDVTISLPHLIGGQGTLASFPLPLSQEEQARLHANAEIVCQAIEDLDAEMAK
jgi:hypothetical protein